jgi:Bacterial protein of unknown function (DUF899)
VACHDRLVTVARPAVVTQSEWDTALGAITEREETVAEAIDQLAAARQRMPMVRVDGDCRFEGPAGERSLAESPLLVSAPPPRRVRRAAAVRTQRTVIVPADHPG